MCGEGKGGDEDNYNSTGISRYFFLAIGFYPRVFGFVKRPEFHAKSLRERVVRRVREQREGKLSNAHTARVLRRANARWPGKRCRRSQSAGIES